MPVGIPILFEGNLSPSERRHVHYGEVGIKHGVLVTSGMSGYTLVVTGAAEQLNRGECLTLTEHEL